MTSTAPHRGDPFASTRSAENRRADDGMQQIRTVADLAELLAGLPSQTPVTVDPVLRAAPGLSPDHHPRVVAVDTGAFGCGSLELAARLLPEEGAPIPSGAYACDPLQRMAEAFDAGDVGNGLRALADALSDAARTVNTEGTAWLPTASLLVEPLAEVTMTLSRVAATLRSSLAPAADAEMRRAELA
jgi:hypothetical protein